MMTDSQKPASIPDVWTEVKSESDLPEEGKYVIGKHNRGTWIADDQKNVNTVIVALTIGVTEESREASGNRTYRHEDQWGNNRVPWAWCGFGSNSFNGQEITHWMAIPDAPDEANGDSQEWHDEQKRRDESIARMLKGALS